MTTTLTKSKNPSSEMKHFTGMESLNFKMVSILFIIILNVTGLSAQTFKNSSFSSSVIKPTVSYYKKSTTVSRPVMPKIYNLHIVREFPVLEGVSKQELRKMEDQETFDYELIFGSALRKANEAKLSNLETSTAKTI